MCVLCTLQLSLTEQRRSRRCWIYLYLLDLPQLVRSGPVVCARSGPLPHSHSLLAGSVFRTIPAPLSESGDLRCAELHALTISVLRLCVCVYVCAPSFPRMREFDKMDVAYFCHASESHKMYLYWQKQRLRWWKQVGGVNGGSGWGQ